MNNMYKIVKYKETDLMSDLICENYPMLLVLSRFGIALGFGDKSIEEVCTETNVDINTFLAVVNLLIDEERDAITINDRGLSITSLLLYLRKSHLYFCDFRLPSIRRKLIEAIDCGNSDIALVIIQYYDEYVAEVRKHMMYEETTVFPYVEKILDGDTSLQYNIKKFSSQHNKVDDKLFELKNIIIKYYPAQSSNELNSVLFDIFSCAQDLASHNDIEDCLLVPAIKNIELKQNKS